MLVEVLESRTFGGPAGLLRVLPVGLVEPFTTLDLALALEVPRDLAQRVAYTLRVAGLIEVAGRRGRAVAYCRAT